MNLQQLKDYFNRNHAKVTNQWFEQKIQAQNLSNTEDYNGIFQQWLNENWIQDNRWCSPSLPQELNLTLLNIQKQTFNGHYILQVEKMIDISRPLPMKNDKLTKDNDKNDEENEEDDELSETNKRYSGKKNANKTKFYGYGKRLWQFLLIDGHQQCLAIEYEPIDWLKQPIIDQKILLSGPFDAYMGTIFLKKSNLKLLTDISTSSTTMTAATNHIDLDDLLDDDYELEMVDALS